VIDVVGISGPPSAFALALVAGADVVVGGPRLLSLISSAVRPDTHVVSLGPLDVALDQMSVSASACVLASGDPGFFGIVRAVVSRFGSAAVRVHPAPSSVSLAFARLALPWDDAAVVSTHGRPVADAARLAARCPKVALLTSPSATASEVAVALVALGATHAHAAVCSQVGFAEERVFVGDLAAVAAGSWDPVSVLVLWSGSGVAADKSLGFGLPETAFAFRDGMITKSEVRAVVVGLLDLPGPASPAPVLWDVGAGSGSVAIECALLAPWMEVIAIDQSVSTVVVNAAAHGVAVRTVCGSAPDCFEGLPDPDRVFVGGGGVAVLSAARSRVRPGGIVVATHAALDRAAAAADLLGNVTQIAASRGARLPGGGWRLTAANPVFVTWGRA
jgi:precorrin-6Y C5,15-methyltransferase (decarboxylating)